MSEEEKNNQIINDDAHNVAYTSELDVILERLHRETDFASKSFENKTIEFNRSLNDTIVNLRTLLTELTYIAEQNKKQNEAFTEQLKTYFLLPEKIQQRISAIVPEIAQQVANIYNSKSQKIEQQHELLLNKLSQATDCFEQKITDTTSKSLSKLLDATNQCSATIEANLNRYSTQLMQDATTATTNNRSKFFNNLAIMVVFAAIVSALTSYVVASQFPRYIEINRANDLSIYDSKVQVWGGKIKEEKDSGKK